MSRYYRIELLDREGYTVSESEEDNLFKATRQMNDMLTYPEYIEAGAERCKVYLVEQGQADVCVRDERVRS